jgi:dienelactone hydrolase
MSVRRSVHTLLAASILVVCAACGSSTHKAATPRPFAYDTAQPLGYKDNGRANHGYPIAIHDVSYLSGGDRIGAYLALPPANGKRRPAVVYLHGSGGDRTSLIVPATWLAGRGAVALAITAPSSTASAATGGSAVAELRHDVQVEERDVIAVRRAIDLLRRRPDVDPNRIGFVGWSAGARTGAILAGVEHRLRTLVLMSAGASPISLYSRRAPRSLRPALRRDLGSVDPLRYIRRAKGSGLLLQDGRNDTVVPRSALLTLSGDAPSDTTVRFYNAGHALNSAAYRDQLAWLSDKLEITGPPIKGAITGPK